MTDAAAASVRARSAHLAGEVRQHDRDRYRTSLFAPAEKRTDLWALYAFNAEVARIPDSVSESILGRMKIQWWRDVVTRIAAGGTAPAGHPIAESLAAAIATHGLEPGWFDQLLTAREQEVTGEEFATIDALEAYVDHTAGRLAWLALQTLGVIDEASRRAVYHAAAAYGLVGLSRTIPFQIAHNRLLMPADALASGGVTLAGLQSGQDRQKLPGVVGTVIHRARMHLLELQGVRRAADRRAMPVLLWAALADGAIKMLARCGDDVFDARAMTHRAGILPLMWRAWVQHI